MYSWVFVIVMGALYTFSKVSVLGDSYDGELVMESNVTLDVQTILNSLNTSQGLQVNNSNGVSDTVTFLKEEVAAECLIIGTDSSCNCSTGYTWSNDMCYNYSCCNDSTCTANVSYVASLCVPKVNVQLDGSVILNSTAWDSNKLDLIKYNLQHLNGLQSLNIRNSTNQTAAIQATVSVRIVTSRLQDLIDNLQTRLNAIIVVNILGMVTIHSPNTSVCYESSLELKCTLEQKTDSAGWTLNQNGLNPGTVVQLNNSCAPTENSCTALTLQKVTGAWAGTYECTFTTGSVTHTARTQLNVSLLPDVITMETSPLTADCSQTPNNISLNVSTTILQSTENYVVWWNSSPGITILNSTAHYTCNATITCQQNSGPLYINVTFKNTKGQTKTAQVYILVIYAQTKFCKRETIGDDSWPNTPSGSTVTIQSCTPGRSGNKSRYCDNTEWQLVYDNCVKGELITVSNYAQAFLMGMGATQEKATSIFETIMNTSNAASNPSIADISASINILNVMAQASENTVLTDTIFPTFVNAASNMVNQTWETVNTSILYSMSSSYLQSVENLVANVKVNTSQGADSTNMNLAFCSGAECNTTVFDIAVNINKTNGTLKFFALKNLVDKLNNNYNNMDATVLLSATLQENNDSSLNIQLDFPNEGRSLNKAICVFWNTTGWSEVGCTVNVSDENHTVCVCNHLTSFSVLISKDEVSPYNNTLDIITNVGLGVSIFSLMIFLTIECLVWSAVVKTNLAHFRHTAMVNIATFLLLADISFLASTRPGSLPDSWCLILTICKHLFYLAMFCWMLCLSVMLVHQLIFVFSPLRKRVFMVFSSIVGYVLPILIVGSSYVYSTYMGTPYYDKKTCWLIFRNSLDSSIQAFLLPVGTIILTNIFCMMVIILTLVKSWVPNANKADDKMTAKSMLKVMVVLTPILGITWIIGFFQLLFPEDALKFCFTILNSFQGIFILLTGCFTEQKIREELYKMIMAKSKGTYDSSKNLISTTDTRVK